MSVRNNKLLKAIEKKTEGCPPSNIKGSVCSYFLQDYENKVLELIYSYCVINRYIINGVCSLCFDGLMIPKTNYKECLLTELQEMIYFELGFKLVFTEKKMTSNYLNILDEHQNKIEKPKEDDKYKEIKSTFEQSNFKILNPIMFGTISHNNNLILRNKKSFVEVYENLRYKTDLLSKSTTNEVEKEVSFVSCWLKDATMRTYDELNFFPCQIAPANIYNTFSGFVIENQILYDVDLENSCLMTHLKNLCDNATDVVEYVLNVFSNMVQHPNKKTNIALLFKSIEGCGKDTFFNWFGNHILGAKYYTNEDKPELLFGRFNSMIENKIFCVLNEASGKQTHEIHNNIKNAITRDINTIEKKGLTPYDNNNNIQYFLLTNTTNAIKVDENDRRFCAIECNNLIANNQVYFNALQAEIKEGNHNKAFYNMLMSRNIENYDFTNNRPKTKLYNAMRESNIPFLPRELVNTIFIPQNPPLKVHLLYFGSLTAAKIVAPKKTCT